MLKSPCVTQACAPHGVYYVYKHLWNLCRFMLFTFHLLRHVPVTLRTAGWCVCLACHRVLLHHSE